MSRALVLTSRREYAQAMRAVLLGLGVSQVDLELDALRAMEIAPQPYDLILIDSSLGGTDGLQLLVLFRQQAPQCRFIVVGEKDDQVTRTLAVQNGAELYLERPGTVDAYQQAAAEIKKRLHVVPADRRTDETEAPAPPNTSSGMLISFNALTALAGDTTADATPELPSEAPPLGEAEARYTASGNLIPPLGRPAPAVFAHWKVDLMGNLVENSPAVDPDRGPFLTNFIYRKLADVAVALEVDYFDRATLWGPHYQQVLVADNLGVRHALFETASATEAQRAQYLKWCREPGL